MGHPTKMSVVAAAHESSLLLTLEEISQLVSHSHNPHETLENIVRLIQAGVVQGVLVVQTVERRAFFPNEIRMLVAAGAQLAPVVSGARLLERVAAADSQIAEALVPRLPRPQARSLTGSALSSGTGL